jgi:hypothetical protein
MTAYVIVTVQVAVRAARPTLMLVTVMAYVPGGADSPAATTIRAVPPVATAAGARATVTPVGIPLTDRPTGGPAGAQAVKAARID